MRMAREYLPKLAIATLALSVVALVLVSAQPAQVAASPTLQTSSNSSYSSSTQPESYHHHHYSWGGGSWYGGWYYPYYSYYYPYYYSSSYCPSTSNSYYYGYPYYYSYYYPYYSSYYGSNYSNYSCSPSSYTLTVNTNPANLGTVTGGGSYTPGSSASISVTQNTIQVSPNTRYVFQNWSGDYTGSGTSASVTVNNAMTVTAQYQLQYYISANAQPPNAPPPQGSGWYNAGTTASIQSSSQTVGDSQSRLVFEGMSVDGQPPQPSSGISVVANAPHNITAIYGQQYYLNVQTDQGVASGSGWYDSGSTAQINVSTPVSTQYGVSIIFNGWQGDINSTSQSTSVVMNGPMNAVATWRTDSTVLYLTIAAVLIAAVLIVAAVIAFVARGRGNRQTPPPQPTQTPATSSPQPTSQPANQQNEPKTGDASSQPTA